MRVHARVAGVAYVVIIVASILNLVFVGSRLEVAGDPVATMRNISGDLALFRAGLAVDLVMFAGVVLLAWALYQVLRTVSRSFALLGLLWRMAEAIIGGVTVLLGMAVVALLSGAGDSLAAGEKQALMEVLLSARAAGFDIVVFFLCLGTLVFCGLLWKSRYVPRWLSGLGLASFVLMLVSSLLNVLTPELADLTMLFYAPGIIFELSIGVWLAVRGVKSQQSQG